MSEPWDFFEAGGALPDQGSPARQADAIIEALQVPAGARVLELGSGSGRHLAALRERGIKVSGIEAAPSLVERTRASGLDVVRGDARRLDDASSPYDGCVVLPGVLGSSWSAGDDLAVLKGALRMVRPGGRVFLAVPHVTAWMRESAFDALSCRRTFIADGPRGKVELEQRAFHRAEMAHAVERAGGRPVPPRRGAFGEPQTQPSHPTVVVVAERPVEGVHVRPAAPARDAAWYVTFFQDMGAEYLDYRFTRGTEAEVEVLKERLALKAGDRLLDVACGVGRHSLALARQGFTVQGIDLSPAMIDSARRQAAEAGLPCTFEVCDARDIPASGAFDAAWCVCEGAFSLLEDDGENLAVLRSIYGALKPGGRFLLTTLNLLRMLKGDTEVDLDTGFESWIDAPRAQPDKVHEGHNRGYLFPEIVELMREVGFQPDAPPRNFCFGRPILRVDDMELNLTARRPADKDPR